MVRFAPIAVLVLVASSAHAQLVHRDAAAPAAPAAPAKDAGKKDAKDAKDTKKSSDDDDILAPKGEKATDTAPADAAKPKQFSVGLVGIVSVGDAGKTMADKVTTGLQKELGAGHVFDVQALAVDVKSTAGAGSDVGAATSAMNDAKGAFDKGQKALDALKFGVAKKAFQQALDAYEKAAPVLNDADPLIRCRLGLAEVAAREGNDDEAAIELAAAAALNPERQLDKKKYPGAFITTFLRQRDKVLKDARGTVVVDASGAGATVEIDGRAQQGAPLTITDVPAGRHLVRAVREGLPAYGTVVEVKGGDTATVSPGFIAKDGHSYIDDLQNNRFTADAAKSVADAAKAANEKAGVVGVVDKSATGAVVQLVLVDANGAGMIKLPALNFTGDMLDIGIETLKARDAIENALGADAKPVWSKDALAVLVEGAKAGASARMASVQLRYDVTPLKAPTRSRIVGDDGKKVDDNGDAVAANDDASGDNGDHKVLNAGKNGTRKRLEDEEDPYAGKNGNPSSSSSSADSDAPITDQPWFWPTVIGGGAAGVVVILGVATVGLVAAHVVPDPRQTSGAVINVQP